MRVLSQDDNVDDNIDINNNDLIIHNISNPINEDSDDEYINSSDEEQSEDVIVLIVCSQCRVEMGTNEEHLTFPSGIGASNCYKTKPPPIPKTPELTNKISK